MGWYFDLCLYDSHNSSLFRLADPLGHATCSLILHILLRSDLYFHFRFASFTSQPQINTSYG